MGIKTAAFILTMFFFTSEKPPHHMGIKTKKKIVGNLPYNTLKNLPTTWGLRHDVIYIDGKTYFTLKNLPTTWGLRQFLNLHAFWHFSSEKPPHHMGIKTNQSLNICLDSLL